MLTCPDLDRSDAAGALRLRARRALLLGLFALATALAPKVARSAEPPAAAGEMKVDAGAIAADTVWEGRILVEGSVTVPDGVTLTVRPGTEIRFATTGGLVVSGVLRAEGAPDRPILFVPAAPGQEPWAGIGLGEAPVASLLRFCRVAGAQVISISGGAHRIEDCEIADGVVGISMEGAELRPVLARNRISGMRSSGIQCLPRAAPVIADNVIERCGQVGIGAQPGSLPEIRGNRISGCGTGIELRQVPPRISGNTVTDCSRGIALVTVAGGEPVRGNRLERNEAGILCDQYASPEVSGNTIVRNGHGIVCVAGSRPLIRGNDILDNERGLFCDQFADPEVRANTIAGNRCAVYLDRSSYAVIHGNNIPDNEIQVQLGYMSREWETRSKDKPMRGRTMQNLTQRERGVAGGAEDAMGDGLEIDRRSLDLSDNWWGEATTRELEEKGPDANISSFRDGRDPRPYESLYQQDRIVYAPWAKARIPDTGVPAPPAAAPGP